MSLFRRLSATIASRVDQLVGEIEDHDAVVESVIRNARRAVARSRVRLAHLRSEGGRLRRRLAELGQAEKRWAERARAVAGESEEKALQCLRQRHSCQQQIGELKQAIEKHQALEARLVKDVKVAEQRVEEMAQQRRLMRTRQSAAEALTAMNVVDEDMLGDVNAAFERWEVSITEEEMEAGTTDVDEAAMLEQEFIDAEEKAELQVELQALLASEEVKHESA